MLLSIYKKFIYLFKLILIDKFNSKTQSNDSDTRYIIMHS